MSAPVKRAGSAEQARRRRPRPSRSRGRPGRTSGRRAPRTRRSPRRAGRRSGTARRRGRRRARRGRGRRRGPARRGAGCRRRRRRCRRRAGRASLQAEPGDAPLGRRAPPRSCRAGVDGRGRAPRCGGRASPPPASSTCTGHQPRRHLDDVGLEAELAQRVGRLEPEQPAADDGADRRAGRPHRGSPRGPRWCGRRSSRRGRGRASAARTARRRWPAPARRTRSTSPVGQHARSASPRSRPRRPRCRATQRDPRVVVRARRAAGTASSAPTSKNDVSATRSYAGRGSSPMTTTS